MNYSINSWLFWILTTSLLTAGGVLHSEDSLKKVPDGARMSAAFKQVTPLVLIRKLAVLYDANISFEGSGKNDDRLLDFAITNATKEEALDVFVATDRRFVWKYDEENGIFNVYPSSSPGLQWIIKDVVLKDDSLTSIFIEKDILTLNEHNIQFFHGTGNITWVDTTKVTLTLTNLSARDALNAICAKVPSHGSWELLWYKERGVLQFSMGSKGH